MNNDFTHNLLHWWATNKRFLPWKSTQDPYTIWLSEIILQQTRVEQGLPYFLRFTNAFPTVYDLAAASIDTVMRHWEGLGYYSRARNLHETAQHIVNNLGGVFPNTFEGIKQLKGVGDYTAAAIASFAFGLPYSVVDGNVYRVLARVFGIATPIDTIMAKRQFAELAQSLICKEKPADFNQAIMDFGATCCLPANPNCANCPLQLQCYAYQNGEIADLPFKSKKIVRRKRYFTYLLISDQAANMLIKQRTDKDIWQLLHEFPMIETDKNLLSISEAKTTEIWQQYFGDRDIVIKKISKPYRQLLTHVEVVAQFFELQVHDVAACSIPNAIVTTWSELGNYAFPKVINQYNQDCILTASENTLFGFL